MLLFSRGGEMLQFMLPSVIRRHLLWQVGALFDRLMDIWTTLGGWFEPRIWQCKDSSVLSRQSNKTYLKEKPQKSIKNSKDIQSIQQNKKNVFLLKTMYLWFFNESVYGLMRLYYLCKYLSSQPLTFPRLIKVNLFLSSIFWISYFQTFFLRVFPAGISAIIFFTPCCVSGVCQVTAKGLIST